LGNQIGITLIATGFNHSDPFAKDHSVKKSLDNERVILQLETPAQPLVAIPITKEIPKIDNLENNVSEMSAEPKNELPISAQETLLDDSLMPKLVDYNLPETTQQEEKLDNGKNDKIFFEISSSADQIPTTSIDFHELVVPSKDEQKASPSQSIYYESPTDATNHNSHSSGGYLAKPSQIYAEDALSKKESETPEKLLTTQSPTQEDEPVIELQLVVKQTQNVAEEPVVQQTQPIMKSTVEEPAMQDETEELRRRAAERIAKLRNLSFNVNAADPNNEFETVPAYLRRNMDMTNQIADVETFYSAYTVKSNENNQAEIGTINTFLEGKKPD